MTQGRNGGPALALVAALLAVACGEPQGIEPAERPDSAALNQIGADLYGEKRYEDALAAFDEALEMNPWVPTLHRNRGMCLYWLGRKDEAIEAFRSVLELAPQDTESHRYLIVTLGEVGRFEDAVEACVEAQEQVPDYLPPYNRHGEALFKLERYEDALGAFDVALQLSPEDATLHYYRGATLVRMGFLDQVLEDVARLRELGSPLAEKLEQEVLEASRNSAREGFDGADSGGGAPGAGNAGPEGLKEGSE